MVAVRWTMTGTHRGDLLDVPPTHRSFTTTGGFTTAVQDAERAVQDFCATGT